MNKSHIYCQTSLWVLLHKFCNSFKIFLNLYHQQLFWNFDNMSLEFFFLKVQNNSKILKVNKISVATSIKKIKNKQTKILHCTSPI